MGNECKQIECQSINQSVLRSSIIQRHYPEDRSLNSNCSPYSFEGKSYMQKSRIQSFVLKLKESNIDMPLCKQNETETRFLRININKNMCKFLEYSDENSSLLVHVVQIGNFLQVPSNGDGITMKMINDTKKDLVMITIFAGKYVNGVEAEGMYASFKWQGDKEEAFLFKGVKHNNKYKGFKLVLGQKVWDKFWGLFDQNYFIQGKGKHLYFSGEHYEYYEGNFQNERKEQNQQGRMKIFDLKRHHGGSVGSRQMQSQNNQFLQAIFELKKKLYIYRSQNQDEICDELMKIMSKGAVISPMLNKYFVESDKSCKILIEGMWKDDKIKGFTIQQWPLINYKYVGMYTENQRCGYGQQYQDDVLIAKGFYKHNKMAIMRDNQNLYKGYRYIDGKSSRRIQ